MLYENAAPELPQSKAPLRLAWPKHWEPKGKNTLQRFRSGQDKIRGGIMP